MADKNRSQVYKMCGAPLKNTRQDWGSVRSDGTVFLTVWADEYFPGKPYSASILTSNDRGFKNPAADLSTRSGLKKRKDHVALIKSGRPYYLIMATAKDEMAHVREVKAVDDMVYVGGPLFTDPQTGNIFATWTSKVPASSV